MLVTGLTGAPPGRVLLYVKSACCQPRTLVRGAYQSASSRYGEVRWRKWKLKDPVAKTITAPEKRFLACFSRPEWNWGGKIRLSRLVRDRGAKGEITERLRASYSALGGE